MDFYFGWIFILGGFSSCDDLPFLAFLEKARKTHPKKQGFFHYAEPLKSLGKKGKTLKKARKFLATKKARKSKKAGKGRSGHRKIASAAISNRNKIARFEITERSAQSQLNRL